MTNTHIQPSMMAETQAICADLLAPAILGSSLTTPSSGMTLPAFATSGYVRNGSPTRLVYVNQAQVPVTISGGDGYYWLALMHDTHSPLVSWIRQPGTHYAWLAAGTQPVDPPGGLVMASLEVEGGSITGTNSSLNYPAQKVAFGSTAGTLAFDKNLTWDYSSLHVVGTVEPRRVAVSNYSGNDAVALLTDLQVAGGTNRWSIFSGGDAPSFLGGPLQALRLGLGSYPPTDTLSLTLLGSSLLNGTVGIMGTPVEGYGLTNYGQTQMASGVTVNMIGTTATRTFDVNGSARVRETFDVDAATTLTGTVGIMGPPLTGYGLTNYGETQLAANVTVNMIGTPATSTFDVNGTARVRGALYVDAPTTLANIVGIGGAPNPSYQLLNHSTSLLYGAVGIGGGPNPTNGILTVYGNTYMTGSLICGNTTVVALGVGGAGANPSIPLNNLGSSSLNGAVGVGGTPNGAQGMLSVYGTIWSNAVNGLTITQGGTIRDLGLGGYGPLPGTPLNLLGNAIMNGVVGIAGTPNAAQGVLSVYGTIWSNAVNGLTLTQGGSIRDLGLGGAGPTPGTPLNNLGTSYLQAAVGVLGVPNAGQGALSVYGSVWLSGQLLLSTGNGYKPGGGTWADINSSATLKRHIRPVEGAVDMLRRLRPRWWEWAEDQPELEAALPGQQTGFVIEEMQEDHPAWVIPAPGGGQALWERGAIAYLVAAVQELAQRLQAIEGRA